VFGRDRPLREFRIYHWDPDVGGNPRLDSYRVGTKMIRTEPVSTDSVCTYFLRFCFKRCEP